MELHKILQDLSTYTTFGAGEEFAIELYPSTELEEVQLWQRETAEAVALLEESSNISLRGARDVRDPVVKSLRGVIVEPSVLLDIRYTLRRGTTLKRTLGRMRSSFPLLSDLANEIEDCAELQRSIEKTVDDNAEIKDTASARLAIIRRDLKVAFDRLQNKLNRIVTSKANQDKLQEAIVTMRHGRYVIPLKAEHKGKIKGIMHDSSASGATIFIEPLETVELNNKWREMQVAEEKEIRRILADLTDEVAGESERIVSAQCSCWAISISPSPKRATPWSTAAYSRACLRYPVPVPASSRASRLDHQPERRAPPPARKRGSCRAAGPAL